MDIESALVDVATDGRGSLRFGSSFSTELLICRENVAPEQMIVDLKTLLFRLPHFELRRAIERGEMMHQLITVAINAYYARADD